MKCVIILIIFLINFYWCIVTTHHNEVQNDRDIHAHSTWWAYPLPPHSLPFPTFDTEIGIDNFTYVHNISGSVSFINSPHLLDALHLSTYVEARE